MLEANEQFSEATTALATCGIPCTHDGTLRMVYSQWYPRDGYFCFNRNNHHGMMNGGKTALLFFFFLNRLKIGRDI